MSRISDLIMEMNILRTSNNKIRNELLRSQIPSDIDDIMGYLGFPDFKVKEIPDGYDIILSSTKVMKINESTVTARIIRGISSSSSSKPPSIDYFVIDLCDPSSLPKLKEFLANLPSD